ncbi:MAG: TMEM165/GDT1 family protein [Kiritimatiellae bacterium]|nr:TMEM165/GDT1 family protein [Kiritimatiellia bacterium]
MHVRLFLSTFVLIFLAELGDKTQLAAMARAAAGEGDKWTVFLGASTALVLATLLAVLAGDAIGRVVPVRYLKVAAGVLFFAFGLVLIRSGLAAEKPIAVKPPESGPVVNMALRLAAEFEAAAVEDYKKLAAANTNPQLRPLLETLVRAETEHLRRISEARIPLGETTVSIPISEGFPERAALFHNVATDSAPILGHAIEHEMATAQFYAQLARSTHWPALRQIFAWLARDEEKHAATLVAELKKVDSSPNASSA